MSTQAYLSAKKLESIFFNEKYCLLVIFTFYVIIAVFSVTSGVLTHSTALILDGALSIFDVISGLATLIVARLLISPPTQTYQFGYFKLEPLLVGAQAAIMIITCIVSILHSVKELYHDSSFIKSFNWGLSYIVFALATNSIMYYYTRLVYKKYSSPLLAMQVLSWRYGIIVSLGLFLGFIFAYFLEHNSNPYLNSLSRYVDPLMTCIMVMLILAQLCSLFSESLNDLLDRKPLHHSHLEDTVILIAKDCAKSLSLDIKIKYFRVRRAGRAHFCSLGYTINEKATFEQIISLQKAIEKKIHPQFSHFYIALIPEA